MEAGMIGRDHQIGHHHGRTPAALLQELAHPLYGGTGQYDGLIERVGDARVVLIGEATHGTHEFYRERAAITRRLIAEKGFDAVAVEADWPDAYRVNRFVRGQGGDVDANTALLDFKRFPTWMWRNTDMLGFVDWLCAHNHELPAEERAGFYGLDLYSLYGSIDAVLSYLDRVDPAAARRARERYSCFDHLAEDGQGYGYAVHFDLQAPCEDETVAQLVELRQRAARQMAEGEQGQGESLFFAEQNARLVCNAERYYREMFRGRVASWNLRDTHMMETLQALDEHLSKGRGRPARLVVWAHNSHLGDARATEMREYGEFNLGQRVREQYGDQALSIGFSTYAGTVTAAADWDEPAERMLVRPGLPGSYEALFHACGLGNFWMDLTRLGEAEELLRGPRLQRAIGVVYRPHTERLSHYFHTSLSRQFDLLLHFDQTRAVKPLELSAHWRAGDVPETFPSGV
jgi:erythromycin esterase-like protein